MADASPSPTFPKSVIGALPAPGWPPTQRDSTSGIDPARIRRMNLNESPFPPSPRAVAAMQEAVTRLNYYPDPQWRDLTAALAAHTGIDLTARIAMTERCRALSTRVLDPLARTDTPRELARNRLASLRRRVTAPAPWPMRLDAGFENAPGVTPAR